MNAEQMFKELGYEKELIWEDVPKYKNDKYETAIVFHEKNHLIHIYATAEETRGAGMIGIEELRAINEQVKELGWEK